MGQVPRRARKSGIKFQIKDLIKNQSQGGVTNHQIKIKTASKHKIVYTPADIETVFKK